MADNVLLSTVTTGGVSAATDDVGGIQYQRVKIALGADGTFVGDVSDSNPMPVVNSAAVTVTGSVGVSGPVTVTGSVTSAITGPVTVTGTVAVSAPVSVQGNVSLSGGTVGVSGPVTVTGTVAATQSGSWGIAGPVTVTGSVTAVHAGPVTVTGTVAATQSGAWSISANANITNLLGSTVVNASTVTGTIGVAKRVDTQATVNSAVNTATPLHVNEFGSLWVVSEPGDAQVTNGGGTTGIQVFMGAATTIGTVSLSGVLPGPVTVTGSVTAVHAGPVTVTGSVAIAGPVTVAGSISAASLFLEGTSISPGATSIGGAAFSKRVDDASVTVAATVGGGVALQTDAFGKLWVNAGTLSANVSGPMTVTGTVAVTAPVSVQGNVSLAGGTTGISGPVTVTGTVAATQSGSWGIAGPVTVTGSVTAVHAGPVTVTGTVGLSAGTNTNEVVGDAAHGASVAGNPLLLGLEGKSSDQTAVTSGQVTRAIATLLGKLVTSPYAIPPQFTCYAPVTAGLATTVAATAFASAGASTRWYLTSAQFINQGAAVTRVILQDGAGAIYYTASLATSGGGVSATFPVPLRIAANQTVEIKLDTTGTTVYSNLQGFKAAE